MSTRSRWFPDHRRPRQQFEQGWVLADEDRWDVESDGGVDLMSLRLHSPRSVELAFLLPDRVSRVIEFAGLSDLQIDGDLALGLTDVGWEVMGTSMLVSPSGARTDGLSVYVLELPSTLLCFASLPGVSRTRS